jgi:hypothetical protein
MKICKTLFYLASLVSPASTGFTSGVPGTGSVPCDGGGPLVLTRDCLKPAALVEKNEPHDEAGCAGGGGLVTAISGESGVAGSAGGDNTLGAGVGDAAFCAASRCATSLRNPSKALKNPVDPVVRALAIRSRAGPKFSSSLRSFRPSVNRNPMSLAIVTCPAHGCLQT